jgi:hypothetical protein
LTVASADPTRAGENAARLALVLALMVGAALRLWNLYGPSLHTDEAFTFALSALPMPALVHNVVIHDFHPPGFYVATHELLVWLPKPRWDYRYVTALFGCVTILATWGAAGRMFGWRAAAFAGLAVALAPGLVQYDRLYRMYAVTVALSTLAWWLLLEAEAAAGRRRPWLWTAYAVVAIVVPYVDYLGALMLVCQAAYAFAHLRVRWPALVGLALAALAFVPWLGAVAQQLPLGGLALSSPGLDAGLAASMQGAFAAGVAQAWFGWPLGLIAAVAALTVVVAAAWIGRKSALPFWLGALVLQVVGSIVLGKNLAYFPRYLLIDVPAVCIGLGLVLGALATARFRIAAAVLGLAVLVGSTSAAANVLFVPYYQFPDWYALNAVLLAHEQESDAIVLDAGYETLVVSEYTAFRGHELLSFMNSGDFKPILSWIAKHPQRRVWYVEHQNFYWDPQRRIAAALGQTRHVLVAQQWPRQQPVDRVSVMLFGKVPMTKVP